MWTNACLSVHQPQSKHCEVGPLLSLSKQGAPLGIQCFKEKLPNRMKTLANLPVFIFLIPKQEGKNKK